MNPRLYIVMLGLLLCASPALADESSFVWDLSIANAVGQATPADDPCRPNPYALYRHGCSDDGLNISLEGSEEHRLTALDRIALLVYRYKDLNLDTDIRPNAKLKFTMSLVNLYEQEAKARLSLRIRF